MGPEHANQSNSDESAQDVRDPEVVNTSPHTEAPLAVPLEFTEVHEVRLAAAMQEKTPDEPKAKPEPMGTLWVNKEDEPEPVNHGKYWFFGPKALDDKAWAETYWELRDTMKYKRNRTLGEFFSQTMDKAIDQLDPSLKDYKTPEPKKEVPGWWSGARNTVGKLMEGINRRPFFQAPVIGGFFIGSLTAPLPGINIGAIVLAPLGVLFAFAVRAGLHIKHVDAFMRGVDWTGRKIGELSSALGITWVGKRILRQFHNVGEWFDSKFPTKTQQNESKVKERAESGDLFSGGLRFANAEIDGIKQAGLSESHIQVDLLGNFDLSTRGVDLLGLTTHIAAGKAYQDFKSDMKNKGYECRLVQCEHTVVLEVWKTGTSPSAESNELKPEDIPEPRAQRVVGT